MCVCIIYRVKYEYIYIYREREQALERLVLVVFASLASQGLPLMEDRGTGAEGKGMLLQKPFPGEIQYWLRKLITDSMKHNLLTNAGNTPIPQPLLPDYGDPLVQGGGGENNCSRGNNEGESAQDALTQSLAQFTSGGGPQNYPGLGALMKGEGRDRLNSFQIKGNLDDTDYSIYKLEKEFNEGDRKSIGGPINSPLLASPTPLHLDSPYSRSYIGDPSIPNYLKHLELSPAPSPYPNSPKPPTGTYIIYIYIYIYRPRRHAIPRGEQERAIYAKQCGEFSIPKHGTSGAGGDRNSEFSQWGAASSQRAPE